MFLVNAFQSVERDVRVDLRRPNVSMAENGLHGTQVGAVLDHVRSATVAQHVRTGVSSRGSRSLANHLPHSLPRYFFCPTGDEQDWGISVPG
jgi:hypothetical protein